MDQEYKIRPLGYERVYLPLRKVADTPFHIQGDELFKDSSHILFTMLIFIINQSTNQPRISH